MGSTRGKATDHGQGPTGTVEWVTPQELADELRVPLATIYQWRHRGDGPVGHRIGRHVRYRRQDIERWLVQQRDAPPTRGEPRSLTPGSLPTGGAMASIDKRSNRRNEARRARWRLLPRPRKAGSEAEHGQHRSAF